MRIVVRRERRRGGRRRRRYSNSSRRRCRLVVSCAPRGGCAAEGRALARPVRTVVAAACEQAASAHARALPRRAARRAARVAPSEAAAPWVRPDTARRPPPACRVRMSSPAARPAAQQGSRDALLSRETSETPYAAAHALNRGSPRALGGGSAWTYDASEPRGDGGTCTTHTTRTSRLATGCGIQRPRTCPCGAIRRLRNRATRFGCRRLSPPTGRCLYCQLKASSSGAVATTRGASSAAGSRSTVESKGNAVGSSLANNASDSFHHSGRTASHPAT